MMICTAKNFVEVFAFGFAAASVFLAHVGGRDAIVVTQHALLFNGSEPQFGSGTGFCACAGPYSHRGIPFWGSFDKFTRLLSGIRACFWR